MKNIAIIVRCLYGGGAERAAGLLSKYLGKRYKVYLFLAETDNIVYEYDGVLVDLGINGDYYLRYYVAAYKQKYKIDCAISFLEEMNFINIQTKGTEKVIVSERNVQSRFHPPRYYQNQLVEKMYNYADQIVSVAYGVQYDLTEHFGIKKDKITTIYNFIDKNFICKKMDMKIGQDILSFAGNSKIILNIGRLEAQKNQEKLLVQFSRLIMEGEDVKLIIVGSGRLYEPLHRLSADLGISQYVKIVDYVKNPFPFYKIATVFATTSDWEGLPNVILEAMVCGVAVVAVDCLSGARELLKETEDYADGMNGVEVCKNGILVELTDTDKTGETEYFKEAVKLLLHNDGLRSSIADNGKKYIERYSNEKILGDWIRVIEDTPCGKVELPDLADDCLPCRKVIVYGAGLVGKMVMRPYLTKECEYDLLCFAVSSRKENDGLVWGMPVFEIGQLVEHRNDAVVLIAVSDRFRSEVVGILNEYGFKNIVFPFYEEVDYLYHCRGRVKYRDELSKWYRERTNQRLNWDHLTTYNEKLQWLKLFDCTEIKRKLSDRYSVRNYAEERIGNQYMIPMFGCWDSFEQIDFDTLPNRFVLKCTHGLGWTLVVEDKRQLDLHRTKEQIESWMQLDYTYISGFGMNYKNVLPGIMAEERLENADRREIMKFGVFVFNGVAKVVQADMDRSTVRKRNLYSVKWEYLPYGIGYPMAPDYHIDKPDCLEQMVRLSEKIGEEFKHIRVDFYLVGSRLYFSNIVFAHGNGTESFTSDEFAVEMGSWITLL